MGWRPSPSRGLTISFKPNLFALRLNSVQRYAAENEMPFFSVGYTDKERIEVRLIYDQTLLWHTISEIDEALVELVPPPT